MRDLSALLTASPTHETTRPGTLAGWTFDHGDHDRDFRLFFGPRGLQQQTCRTPSNISH